MRVLFAGSAFEPQSLSSRVAAHLGSVGIVIAETPELLIEYVTTDVFDALVLDEALYFHTDVRAAVTESATVSVLICSDVPPQPIEAVDEFVIAASDHDASAEIAARLSHAVERQATVERSLQRNEIASDAIQDIVYRLDTAGHFTYLNQSVSQLGYDESELIGKHFTALLDERTASRVSRDQVLPAYVGTSSLSGETPKLFDERRRGPRRTQELAVMLKPAREHLNDTILGYVTASGDVVTRSDGTTQVVGTIGVIRNASRQEESIDLLRKLYAVADSAQVGILVTDPTLRVQYANPSFYRMSELNPDDVLGHSVGDVAAEGFTAELQDELLYACSAEIVVDHEFSVSGRDNGHMDRVITGRPVYNAQRECEGTVLVVQPANIRDDLNLPESAAAIVERAVNAFRRESGGISEVSVELPDRSLALSSQPASYLYAAVRDLLILASVVTDGGTVTISAWASADEVQLRLVGRKGETALEQAGAVSARMQAAVARTEMLRAELREFGGDWLVNRREGSIEFLLSIPSGHLAQKLSRKPSEKPKQSVYDIRPFLNTYSDNQAVLSEILRLFEDEAPRRISSISEALPISGFDTIADAAHSLANTCGTLQSSSAAAAARKLEAAARAADEHGCRQAFTALSGLVEHMLAAVREARASSGDQGL